MNSFMKLSSVCLWDLRQGERHHIMESTLMQNPSLPTWRSAPAWFCCRFLKITFISTKTWCWVMHLLSLRSIGRIQQHQCDKQRMLARKYLNSFDDAEIYTKTHLILALIWRSKIKIINYNFVKYLLKSSISFWYNQMHE